MTALEHASDDAALLAWVQERDVACPLCDYNLRALTEARCPECRHRLRLSVGTTDVPLGWFIAAIAPGIFSGIAACFLLIPILIADGGGGAPWFIIATDCFGFASGIAAIMLVVRRRRFLRARVVSQRLAAILIWALHIAMFGLLMNIALRL